jgi:RNA polymerase sigma factor FliA
MTTAGVRSDQIKAYKRAQGVKGSGERETEIIRHLPLVHSVVERIAAHLPATVDKDDLFHAGVIGLIDALNRFDASRDNAFSTYAVLRIRGQVIDELRARDWVPRSARTRAREYQHAVNELSHRLGRLPQDQELAAHLGVSVSALVSLEQEAQLGMQVSLDAPSGDDSQLGATLSRDDDEEADPSRNIEAEDRRALLMRLLGTLTQQERLVIKLYYFENLLLKQIAEILGLTESRICQIHSRVLALLKTRLGDRDCA